MDTGSVWWLVGSGLRGPPVRWASFTRAELQQFEQPGVLGLQFADPGTQASPVLHLRGDRGSSVMRGVGRRRAAALADPAEILDLLWDRPVSSDTLAATEPSSLRSFSSIATRISSRRASKYIPTAAATRSFFVMLRKWAPSAINSSTAASTFRGAVERTGFDLASGVTVIEPPAGSRVPKDTSILAASATASLVPEALTGRCGDRRRNGPRSEPSTSLACGVDGVVYLLFVQSLSAHRDTGTV
jgi:hypothetical protein